MRARAGGVEDGLGVDGSCVPAPSSVFYPPYTHVE